MSINPSLFLSAMANDDSIILTKVNFLGGISINKKIIHIKKLNILKIFISIYYWLPI